MAHIEKRGTNRWRARYRTPQGRERSRTFSRKIDAERWLATTEADKIKGEWVDPSRQRGTVVYWFEQWRKTIVHLEPTTIAWYEAKLRHHILPALGSLPIGSLDNVAVKRWISEMQTAGKGPRTIRGAFVTLNQVVNAARSEGVLRLNPCDGVKLPRIVKAEMLFLTVAEVQKLAETIKEPYGTLIRFAAYSGMRAGEIGGLRVGRLDLLGRRVEVCETLKELNGNVSFGTTKTHENRTIHIPRQLCDELGHYLAGRPHRRNDLVFTAPNGGALRHNLFYRRTYKPAVVEAGLSEQLRFHDLRHTCAAHLIGQGHQQYEIMRHLGHSSIQTTIDTYGHLFDEMGVITWIGPTWRRL